jgi:hypothetical protein
VTYAFGHCVEKVGRGKMHGENCINCCLEEHANMRFSNEIKKECDLKPNKSYL